MPLPPTVHATAVATNAGAVLLRGPSGSGKSAVALLLLQRWHHARLVADDRVVLVRRGAAVEASPPDLLAGLLEVRGAGILKVPHRAPVPVTSVVDLVPPALVDRMPEPGTVSLQGISLPALQAPAGAPAHAASLIMAWLDFGLATAAGPAVARPLPHPGTPARPRSFPFGRC